MHVDVIDASTSRNPVAFLPGRSESHVGEHHHLGQVCTMAKRSLAMMTVKNKVFVVAIFIAYTFFDFWLKNPCKIIHHSSLSFV